MAIIQKLYSTPGLVCVQHCSSSRIGSRQYSSEVRAVLQSTALKAMEALKAIKTYFKKRTLKTYLKTDSLIPVIQMVKMLSVWYSSHVGLECRPENH